MNSQKNFVASSAPRNIFDKEFAFAVVLVIIVIGLWVTERVLIYLVEKQTTEYQATTAASLSAINAEDVQAVHDITSRITVIEKEGATTISTNDILTALEKTTIPQVRLTEYEYQSDGNIAMKGIVADYRLLAEQILRYRQEAIFANAEVTSTDRNEAGQIVFGITVVPEEAAAEVPVAPTL